MITACGEQPGVGFGDAERRASPTGMARWVRASWAVAGMCASMATAAVLLFGGCCRLPPSGPAAPGGRYNYVINGNMIAGFALVAAPVKYGSSGIMTFVISHQGIVYQKDLGPDTDSIVRRMTEYNPDKTWERVKD